MTEAGPLLDKVINSNPDDLKNMAPENKAAQDLARKMIGKTGF